MSPQAGAAGAQRDAAERSPGAGPWRLAGRRLRRNRAALAGAWLLLGIVVACFVLPLLLALDPHATAPALPVSLALGGSALLLALVLGVGLGVRAGLRPRSASDHVSMALALVGLSLPNFVIGAGLVIVFALRLGWLPVAGWSGFASAVLPTLTLALPYAAVIARLARTGTVEVMRQDFVRTARAKGLPERTVVWRHALRPALLPVVSYLGPAAAGILTGSFVVETLFGVPGMGQWFVKGAINRDYPVVLGTALVYFALVSLFNLAVDLAYAWLDPRSEVEDA